MIQPTTLCLRSCRSLTTHANPAQRLYTTTTTNRPALRSTSNNSTTAAFVANKKPTSAFSFTGRSPCSCRHPTVLFPSTRRHASTTAANSSSSAYNSSSPDAPLTWNRFLALRKTRRRMSLSSSIVCAVIATAMGLSAITAADLDSTLAQTLGMDPIAVLGLSTAGLGCAGWLIGPMFGNAAFGVAYRGYRKQIVEKERAFYERIKKHRVDPSNSSIANPVPDYYGEKIGSVTDYRRWLKDQRAFNLKRGRAS